MPRFFTDSIDSDLIELSGENGRHISRSLRMRPGETLTLCDGKGHECLCSITEITGDEVFLKVEERMNSSSEASVFLRLCQCLPKSDKMDLITQKVTELGVSEIVPVNSEFCIAKMAGKEEKKISRWQKIALEAAKQSGRGIIPNFANPMSFKEAVKNLPGEKILFYEHGGEALRDIVSPEMKEITIFIGPEGGFSPEEVAFAKENGVRTATLGPRILRTETAPITAASLIMYMTGNLE